MCSDAELLQRYAEERDERAFAELVGRHLPLVYAAALRRTGSRATVAEDVAQQVFCGLARKSRALVRHTSLIAWLYRSTRYAALDALRAERRRVALTERASVLAEPVESNQAIDWDRLRPVLDAAMDELKDVDREVVLMRYFCALPFAEIGARLGLSENAARMRTERSLDKLRTLLARRGLTSTAAALAVTLGSEACATVPAGLAVSITQAAATVAPAGAGLAATLLMSKCAVSAISGLVAAGLTVGVWTAVTDGVTAADLDALRAENARLAAAAAPGAPEEQVAAVTDDYARQATAIAAAMELRQAQRTRAAGGDSAGGARSSAATAVTARGHSNHGIATPQDAALTFAWACDIADPDELGRIITFDAAGQQAAAEALAAMPEGIRALYPTPETLMGMLLAASCLEAPPPGADVIQQNMIMVEVAPDRFAARRKGSTRNVHEYQRTADGWKYIVPVAGVRALPGLLNSETLARLSEP